MNATELLALAHREGITLQVLGGKLRWKADRPPPAHLLDTLKAHRLEVIAAVQAANDPHRPQTWLTQVAALLDTDAWTLLAEGHVDQHDLAEQPYLASPEQAATLIRSSPAWLCRSD